VVQQLLTESILMAGVVDVLGMGLSWAAIRALSTWGADQLPPGIPISIDLRVLLFTLGLSLLTGIIFGTLPALQLSRIDLQATLRDEGRSSSAGPGRARMKNLLVVGQVALSLLLLIGAGLLLRSFAQLLRVDPGFDAHNVLAMNVSLPTVKYAKPEQQIAFFDEMLRRFCPKASPTCLCRNARSLTSRPLARNGSRPCAFPCAVAASLPPPIMRNRPKSSS